MDSEEKLVEKDLVEYVTRALVDQPDAVQVTVVEGERSTILELRVAPDDVGRVIGKSGRIAKAVRTLINATAVRGGRHVVLEILG